ncbi:MAG TPA: PQQ-binding-like beta-propeller repeat protein [Verrucomicrobiae bacterium]|nr:PQQ-binding-like beta-propeller repeat protein [Verrucomicrobiae bacterium]
MRAWLGVALLAVQAIPAPPAPAAVTEAWVQRYHGPSTNSDYANAVAVDASGNVVVTGSSDNGTNWDYYTAKYAAADGTLLWEKRYNGPVNGYDEALAVAVDGSGNVIVTGSSSSTGFEDYYTAKYAAADGALLWEKRYNGPGSDEDDAFAVAVDGSGNVVVTGQSYRVGSSYDYYTAKYAAADGGLLWEQRYNGPANGGDVATALAVDRGGNVVVTGQSYNGTNADYYTAKYAATNGALLWEQRYNGPGNSNDFANAVAVDASGNVVVTGFSYNATNADYYTAKYAAADGALLWEQRYNGPANGDDRATAIATDASGNVVVTGASEGTNFSDYYTAKYAAPDGTLLWEKRYNGPANDEEQAVAVAVDANGNVVVTGSAARPDDDDGTDCYTAKYAAADGALLWEKRYHGPLYGYDSAVSLALGPNGMVAVTGYSDAATFSSVFDYATVVYRENLPAVSIALIPSGVRLRFPGVAGHSYEVLRAPAVTGPWSTNTTSIAITNGVIEYIDTNAPPGSAFYRTAAGP